MKLFDLLVVDPARNSVMEILTRECVGWVDGNGKAIYGGFHPQ